ncbi:hypothetical protein VNO77_34570 [Canavalia gladiata]|uniref:DUF7745 domain-containing protein n=1 Tax=Canavalia gladiata TaxID=3824 RepID=A0AAN9KHS4_CANGL
MKEVQGYTSNVYDQMRSIKITAQINDLQKVNAACKKMTKEARVNFKKKYGSLLDLLSITVEAPVLSAMAQFWNSNLKCLELPGLDLVPTIEEYEMMLRIPCNEKAGPS